jgi:acetoacetyl-CoA synthetase
VQDYLLNDGTPDVRVLLFVVMRKGNNCSTTFKKDICKVIRDQTSPRHVPSFIIPCPDIPYTVSGKKVELSVKKIMNGKSVTNRSALKNPESLDWFQQYYSSQLTLKN